MKKLVSQAGFSLITAIFLLVAAALLISSIINLSVVQHSTVVMSVQGARAFQAARSALEYGIFRALNEDTCNASESLTFPATEPALNGFDVNLSCEVTTHLEDAVQVNVYELSATASSGNYALGAASNPDFVSRVVRVTVSNQPP